MAKRTNLSFFAPEIKESSDSPLPDPSSLIPPIPGWKLTVSPEPGSNDPNILPVITPLANSKLAVVRSEDMKIHLFYQASDGSIKEVAFIPGTGWIIDGPEIAGAGNAKPGTPLTAVTGGWSEVRVFYVGTTDLLMAAITGDHVPWTPGIALCHLNLTSHHKVVS